ncbi:type III-B CRISPR module RAMP protein Cmr4 [Pontibacter sp. G13]|uniref:type III-B CRISPR module RAMP protein Cmr4 n=1 Tax=Pontibacter sp. G13 TaxID=3074898 RepID=UPI0028890CD6|nr:type III-B CRISPR module RAMP protein Cmr4 [Pontibacter sp. G13]WNJ18626.1 type III-B CRISPR module RAMP protein Cmr4 [Pontibacter sp. G13]
MYKKAKPLVLVCETPMHAGAGNDLGIVDLPIQRERHTSFPKIESSSFKGAVRERLTGLLENGDTDALNDINRTFGPPSEAEDKHAGALGFTDARLLFFPIKSMKGVFAYATCPMILERFAKDLKQAGVAPEVDFSNFSIPDDTAWVHRNTAIVINHGATKKSVILEAYAFSAKVKDEVGEFANWLGGSVFSGMGEVFQMRIMQNLVILPNDDFKDFVNLSTEVITRTKIDQASGTVQDGALFTEEYLPPESILYTLVLAAPVFSVKKNDPRKLSGGGEEAEDVLQFFEKALNEKAKSRLRIGANATLGKGIVQTTFIK